MKKIGLPAKMANKNAHYFLSINPIYIKIVHKIAHQTNILKIEVNNNAQNVIVLYVPNVLLNLIFV
jgi:hypothetical protein